jgi:hypothetical protein
MKPVAIYGWKCQKKDEPVLLKRVNTLLARHRQKVIQIKDRRMFDGYQPFNIKHFYWNLNHAMGTWFDVYPNEDLRGRYFFPDHKDCAWLIHVRINVEKNASTIPDEIKAYIRELLESTLFEHRTIKESGDLHAGLSRGHVS